jgi:hypothetical protein
MTSGKPSAECLSIGRARRCRRARSVTNPEAARPCLRAGIAQLAPHRNVLGSSSRPRRSPRLSSTSATDSSQGARGPCVLACTDPVVQHIMPLSSSAAAVEAAEERSRGRRRHERRSAVWAAQSGRRAQRVVARTVHRPGSADPRSRWARRQLRSPRIVASPLRAAAGARRRPAPARPSPGTARRPGRPAHRHRSDAALPRRPRGVQTDPSETRRCARRAASGARPLGAPEEVDASPTTPRPPPTRRPPASHRGSRHSPAGLGGSRRQRARSAPSACAQLGRTGLSRRPLVGQPRKPVRRSSAPGPARRGGSRRSQRHGPLSVGDRSVGISPGCERRLSQHRCRCRPAVAVLPSTTGRKRHGIEGDASTPRSTLGKLTASFHRLASTSTSTTIAKDGAARRDRSISLRRRAAGERSRAPTHGAERIVGLGEQQLCSRWRGGRCS